MIWGCLGAYLLGSIPFGLLAGRLRGVDIRTRGSGNIGATNVWREVGAGWGIAVFALDFLKGLLPTLAAKAWLVPGWIAWLAEKTGWGVFVHSEQTPPILLGLCAVLGHNFPIWLKFRGGKGVATTAGFLAGAAPLVLLCCAGVWALLFFGIGWVSVASMGAGIAFPIAAWFLGGGFAPLFLLGLLIAAMTIWLHRSNIAKLRVGTEPRVAFGRRGAPPADPPPGAN